MGHHDPHYYQNFKIYFLSVLQAYHLWQTHGKCYFNLGCITLSGICFAYWTVIIININKAYSNHWLAVSRPVHNYEMLFEGVAQTHNRQYIVYYIINTGKTFKNGINTIMIVVSLELAFRNKLDCFVTTFILNDFAPSRTLLLLSISLTGKLQLSYTYVELWLAFLQ